MIVDAHVHFWSLSRGDYAWLTPETGVLYRDYSPTDLTALLDKCNVSAAILVQAAATEAETRYLLRLAAQHPFAAGVVGWVNFESPDAPRAMAELIWAGDGKLKALRPMVQDIDDVNWLASTRLDGAFDAMISYDLAFDALVRPAHFPALLTRLRRHPNLRAVIDHSGKPEIATRHFDQWCEGIAQLANMTSAFCKLSGLLTQCDDKGSFEELAPYVEHVLKVFGPHRVLWGSDWPVVNLAADYVSWLELARRLVQHYAKEHEEAIFGGNAARLYKIALSTLMPDVSKGRLNREGIAYDRPS